MMRGRCVTYFGVLYVILYAYSNNIVLFFQRHGIHIRLRCIMFASTPSCFTLTFVNKAFIFYFPNFYDNEWVRVMWEILGVKFLLVTSDVSNHSYQG